MFVCLYVCLSVWLSVGLLVCLSVCLPACLPVCLSVCVSVCLSDCLSVTVANCSFAGAKGFPSFFPPSMHAAPVPSSTRARTRLPLAGPLSPAAAARLLSSSKFYTTGNLNLTQVCTGVLASQSVGITNRITERLTHCNQSLD